MSYSKLARNSIEALEARIAPAGIPLLPTSEANYVKASFGAAVEVKAGQVLTTGGLNSGTYLLFVEKGEALVFFSDLNNNRSVEFNEVTGISAGDGLQMVSFVDIHGDILTNLTKQTAVFQGSNGSPQTRSVLSLSDSDGNPSNDRSDVRGDGRVLLNNTIEKIELRRLQITDLADQNSDNVVDDVDIILRQGPTTFSIFGNIYAGRGFGLSDGTGGLILNTTGATNFGLETNPTIGSIKTGSAASGEFFSFGASRNLQDVSGTLVNFVPRAGQTGADIIGVRATDATMTFNLNSLVAGDGGVGARGGNVEQVTLNGDDSSGYLVIAGNGGRGTSGGAGGSIIDLADLGSATGEVIVRSGSGGFGANGVGGNAGTLALGTFNVRGDVDIKLGDGGNGFTAGGNGASLSKGSFTEPGISPITAGIGFGTYHPFYQIDPATQQPVINTTTGRPQYQPNIGTHVAIDFNEDGIGDLVFTTVDTSQVVVLLSKDSVPLAERINLSGVRSPGALTVNDLNADGQLDIAVASTDPDAQGKVAVFLSRFENDGGAVGEVSATQDIDRDGRNDFIGFRDVRYSTLPQIERIFAGNVLTGFVQSPIQISFLTSGDFDGDGYAELGAVATFYDESTETNGVVNTVAVPFQVLFFLTPEVERNNLTGVTAPNGQFYADFGLKGDTPAQEIRRSPYSIVNDQGGDTVVLEASALNNLSSTSDVVFAGSRGENEVSTFAYPAQGNAALLGVYALGKVDTNRRPPEGDNQNIEATDVELGEFTVADLNGDENADLGVLASNPGSFFVGVAGSGTGAGIQVSGNGGSQSGNVFADGNGDLGAQAPHPTIKSGDFDNDGAFDDLLFLVPDELTAGVISVKFAEGPQAATIIANVVSFSFNGNEPFAFDVYFPDTSAPSSPSFLITELSGAEILYVQAVSDGTFQGSAITYLVGLELTAGDGGNALVGKGGAGGSLGGGSKIVTTVDATTGFETKDLVGTLTATLAGRVVLTAGAGGSGFSNGGAGGNMDGVSIRYNGTLTGLGVTLIAGDGGRGVSGVGGNGGIIRGVSVESSLAFVGSTIPIAGLDIVTLTAGDGGQGLRGGNGGSVIGNGTAVPDAVTATLVVVSGDGGLGTKTGGNGGEIAKLSPVIRRAANLIGSAASGSLSYTAGDGGNSVAGTAGTGGSIVDSSPRPNARIDIAVNLFAGDGGKGVTGGNGGGISGFAPTLVGPTPRSSQMFAGNGGDGTSGKGGTGGDISEVNLPSRGNGGASNRMLAGDGGDSAGSLGGNGGNISNVISSSPEGSFALVAGAGGDGLKRGGLGGSVMTAVISLGSSPQAKGLVIAGAGGDASAFVPNSSDRTPNQGKNAFGGTVGRGGNGGSIVDFSDGGNIGSHVDLIAGNGGSTLNYGTVTDTKIFVGVGGSIKNVRLTGNAGQIDPTIPIESYNDALNGETIAEYVQTNIRGAFGIITDEIGNVGIVVGAAGRNKAVVADPRQPLAYVDQPAQGSRNGSLIDLTARNLMSAIAGTVDRIASIHLAQNIQILGGIIGADKAPIGSRDYLDRNGNPTTDVLLDGRLIDGALVTGALLDALGRNTSLPSDRIFIKPR